MSNRFVIIILNAGLRFCEHCHVKMLPEKIPLQNSNKFLPSNDLSMILKRCVAEAPLEYFPTASVFVKALVAY